MDTDSPLRLIAADTTHLRQMINWFTDAESVQRWGGRAFTFPFDEQSFARDAKFAELPSYGLVDAAGALCGFGQYYLRLGRCHLSRLAIAPRSRRRGYGARLVQLLTETGCRELQVTECSLFVMISNTSAISLYERLGFVQTRYPGNDLDTSDCHYMVLRAGP